MNWIVIMAGGSGTRFWPLSRSNHPKQLLPVVSSRTLLEETVERVIPFVPYERVLIITNRLLQGKIRKLLKKIPARNIIAEPWPRNTAPCLALAALHIRKRDPEAVFVAMPADHGIRDKKSFQKHLRIACEEARENRHVVFGIPPSSPHTGFGYIACEKKQRVRSGIILQPGKRFVEKPSLAKAKAFLKQKNYFWNSGMFCWKLAFFLAELKRTMPEMVARLERIERALGTAAEKRVTDKEFPLFPNVSIDYGLMEHVKSMSVVRAAFDWSDVGSWQELEHWHKKDAAENVLIGNTMVIESRGNIVRAQGKLVALLGVEDLLIIESADALLIAKKDKAQEVRKIVDELKKKKLTRFI